MQTCTRCRGEFENLGYFDVMGKDLSHLCKSCRHDEWKQGVRQLIVLDVIPFAFGSICLAMIVFYGDLSHSYMLSILAAGCYLIGCIFIRITKKLRQNEP